MQVNKRYSHFFSIGITQFILGLFLLIQALQTVKAEGLAFWITIVVDAGLIISGLIFFVLGVLKHRKYSLSKEDKDIWE